MRSLFWPNCRPSRLQYLCEASSSIAAQVDRLGQRRGGTPPGILQVTPTPHGYLQVAQLSQARQNMLYLLFALWVMLVDLYQ